jgi:dTDP-4-dehydrorhamnose reductase
VKVWISGGSGFVGTHLVRVFDDVCAPTHAEVDVTDAAAVRRSIASYAPHALIHCAILNDFSRLERDGWAGYVGATRNVADAAGEAQVVLISTDWVFSGPADETTPPNPVNLYGVLKAACEMVPGVDVVARISAVQAASDAPRSQDAGFGYFVASLVRALRAGERFTVWEGDDINMVATPTLATDAAELIRRLVEGGHTGIFHCCGGESVDRRTLALRTVEVFGLDEELLDFGPPPEPPPFPIPYDTSLDARATAAVLGVELPSLDGQLLAMTEEVRT